LEFLDRVLVAGGIVIVDDYGFFSSGVQKAVDEFLKAHNKVYRMRASGNAVAGFIVFQKI
jgi:O-methyltransferase